ncbi:hypothetical protein [Parvicella tangerina]|uniref:Amino acid permease/ SLC12A domain-containing protein n=1 Tax=Parvicella tangerina TaxID=2829795 RepID=A0A916NHQ5_9FLAO|nr:hypothetical protein [Parvicella tangerina]CAG5083487.1 hypothetical protein CRYO30217_02211 [Parvicella tangerina]
MKKYGTFAGVFTPSILTILGVIMYMRMGAIVGHSSGIWMTIGIILFAHVISITTGLSVSSVATDKKIKAGGIYYMLSRSLGFPIGGAIGVALFIATALSISLYLIGFSESILNVIGVEEITTNHLRLTGGLTLFAVVVLAFISTSLAMKMQFVILSFIILSLVSIFFGDGDGLKTGTDFIENANFSVLFGIFFPAVTGFTAGVAMSGDLKNPIKSIPWGTMLSIGVGLTVYTALALLLNFSIDKEVLQTNNNAIVEFAAVGFLVVLGIWGATLSSALGGILGAPRILQAMSNDKITPQIFGRGVGENNEPRNALLLTGVIAFGGIMIGELNQIAGIVAMLYMTAYFFINVTCVLEQWASPDFRPTFKIPMLVPLIGAIATIVLMIQLDVISALGAIVVVVAVFFWLAKKQLEVGSGDVWNSVWSSIVKIGLKNLQKKSTHKRNWEPNILMFSGDSAHRSELIAFSKGIAGQNGMISNFDLVKNETASVLFPKHQQTNVKVDENDDAIFYRKQECQNIYRGIENIANTYGFSGIDPNTVLMGWGRNTKDPLEFARMSDYLHQLDHNVLFLDYDEQKGFGAKKTLDIWWVNLDEYCELSLHLSKLMNSSGNWNQMQVRVLFNNLDNSTHDYVERIIEQKCEKNRVNAEVVVVNNELERKSLYELVRKYSVDTDLIFMELPKIEEGAEGSFVTRTNQLLTDIGTTLLIRASSHFYEDINLDPVLQKEYIEMQSKIELDKESVEFMAKSSAFPEVNHMMEEFANKLYEEHHQFSKKVYHTMDEVYNAFVVIADELMYDEDAESKFAAAFDDFRNERIAAIKSSMQTGLKELLLNAQGSVSGVANVINLVWTPEMYQVSGTDGKTVARAKNSIAKRKGQVSFPINQVVSHHLEETYLKDFKRMLYITGLSGFILNNFLMKRMGGKSVDLQELKNELGKTIQKEHQIFLKYSKSYIQKLIQKVVDDAENPMFESVIVEREEEKDTNKVKRYLVNLSKYPNAFLRNQQLLTNQLEGLFYLKRLNAGIVRSVSHHKQLLKEGLKAEEGLINAKLDEFLKMSKDELLNRSVDLPDALVLQGFVSKVNLLIGELMLRFKEELKVINAKSINEFEKDQEHVSIVNVAFKKTVMYAVENEFVVELSQRINELQYGVNIAIDDLSKSLRLLQFQFSSVDAEETEVQEVKDQVKEKLEVVQKEYAALDEKLNDLLDVLLEKLSKTLDIDVLLNKSDFSQSVYIRQKAYNQGTKYLDKTKKGLRFLDRKIDDVVIKLRDTVSKSSFEYRTKGLVNLQSKLADFVEEVSLKKRLSNEIPYFYQQLFTSKQVAPDQPLMHRSTELKEAYKALERWETGASGVLLFTGEAQSGKSYVKQNFINAYLRGKSIQIERKSRNAKESFVSLLQRATGVYSDVDTILSSLDQGTVIDVVDVENFYGHEGDVNEELSSIFKWAAKYYGKLFFVMDCNIHFYNFAKHAIDIDDYLLASVVVRPLSTQAIKDIVLERHRAGGLKFFWDEHHEDDTKLRKLNKLMTRITSNADGNVGSALYLWLGGVEETENNVLVLGKFEQQEIGFKLKSEWELILYQVLLRKNVLEEELVQMFDGDFVNGQTEVYNLLRSGVLQKNMLGDLQINPYACSYVVKYLRRQQIIV